MSKTEQIIATYLDPHNGGTDADLINELRRLAKLQEAYWAECEAWREAKSLSPISLIDAPIHRAKSATDAARREAGEV